MFDFLKKTPRGAPKAQVSRGIEVISIDDWKITFRSTAVWSVRETLLLSLFKEDVGVNEQAHIEVYITFARAMDDNQNEYSGQIRHAPAQVAQWFAPASKGKHAPQAEKGVVVSELRRGRRAVRSFMVVSKDLQTFKALCGDISSSGIKLIADERLEVGRELELDLDFDDFRFPKVRFHSEVVWCRPRDAKSFWVGMRFLDVQEQERKLIETYIGLVDKSKANFRIGLGD